MTKTQTEYAPHDADNLNEGWVAVSDYIDDCVLVAFDGCHKIYLAMDEPKAKFFRDEYPIFIENDGDTYLDDVISDWYESSCALKFIQAVWLNEADENSGFVSLISQGAGWVEREDRDDEDDDEDDEAKILNNLSTIARLAFGDNAVEALVGALSTLANQDQLKVLLENFTNKSTTKKQSEKGN